MSALRGPQAALRLLSTTWRTPSNKSLIQIGDRSPALLSSLSFCNFSSSVKPKEDKLRDTSRSQEQDVDPFGLGRAIDSKEKSDSLVQGFYPKQRQGQEADPSPQQQREAEPPPPRRSRPTRERGGEYPMKDNKLAEYDSWLRRRHEVSQAEKSEFGEAESFHEAHYGKVRVDPDNYAAPKPERRRGGASDSSMGRGFRIPDRPDRGVARDRRMLRQGPEDPADSEPIIETIEANQSVQMRASEFLKQVKGRRVRSGEQQQNDSDGGGRERPFERLVIEKIVQGRKVSYASMNDINHPENYQEIQRDPHHIDSNILPKEFLLPDYNAITQEDMWNILRKCVIFQNDFLLAINKPSGVPCHSKALDCRHFLIQFEKKFADLAKCEKVYPLHRLDKETTGVMLFAKDAKVASILKEKFANHQINKVYLAATKLCPSVREGTIKIPIGEGLIPGTKDRYRQVLRPDLREFGIKPTTRSAVEAITNFRVLHSIQEAAFLEVEPVTGYKHQIRVHLGMGLGCPVIGDHKYSHRDRMAPQRLHPLVCHRIKVKQTKVRDLPLHLHCNKISFHLPKEFTSSTEPVYIHAKIPQHMRYTLKRLGLIG